MIASCFIGAAAEHPYIAVENHLNYVCHAQRELTLDEVYGLAAMFNSAVLDRYFRTISGNTQVNATELRTMPFPSLAVVSEIGQVVRHLAALTIPAVEESVLRALGITGSLKEYLMGAAL